MGDGTAIEWTDATWNPIIGCTRCSPGCDHCYAIGVVHRGMSPQHRGLTIRRPGEPTDWNGTVRFVPHVLEQPLRWTRPRRIFVNSLSDLFHPHLDDDTIIKVLAVIAATPRHTYQVLTKRPQRMAALLAEPTTKHRVDAAMSKVLGVELADYAPFDSSAAAERLGAAIGDAREAAGLDRLGSPWPLPNLWLGVSIEDNRYVWRSDHLRRTPAAVRFVSAERLLGPLHNLNLEGIDWVIAGGESGPGARPIHPDWVRDLRDRCVQACAHVGHWIGGEVGVGEHDGDDEGEPCDRPAFLFKQWGAWAPWIADDWSEDAGGSTFVKLDGDTSWAAGSDDGAVTNWSANYDYEGRDHAVTRVGKGAAGRVLDGRTWDEFPGAVR